MGTKTLRCQDCGTEVTVSEFMRRKHCRKCGIIMRVVQE